MKLEQVAHKHTLTGILKVLLFALLMLAPIFSVASRCLYVICNKNAYQSYSGQNVEDTTYTRTDINNLKVNDLVYYNSNGQAQIQRVGTDLYITASNITLNDISYNNADTIQFYAYPSTPNSNTLYIVIKEGNSTLISRDVMSGDYTCTFNFLSYNSNAVNQNYIDGMKNFYVITYNANSKLDNVFTYSVNEMENDQLFNWTQNTAIYTGINTMTTGIGITQEAIPILLTYWFLLTVIYVIVDIIINTFTLLTHFIQKKTS